MADDLDTGAISDPNDTDVTSNDSGDADASASADASAAAKEKIRLKWLNREEEIDDPKAELTRRFSDDYEYEFRGPKGAPVKAKWQDIERHVQRSAGAENAIRAAQEERKALAQSREWGKKNVTGYLQRYLGIQDPESYFLGEARKRFEQETEIANLMATDPIAAQQKLREIERARLTQAQQWEREEAEARQQAAQHEAATRENQNKMAAELQRVGIKPSDASIARAAKIILEHRQLDIELTYDQVAVELKKQMRAELLASLDEEKDLLGLLGDKRREKLRQLEIEALKQAKKTAKAAEPKKPVVSTPTNRNEKPKSINDLRIKWTDQS